MTGLIPIRALTITFRINIFLLNFAKKKKKIKIDKTLNKKYYSSGIINSIFFLKIYFKECYFEMMQN